MVRVGDGLVLRVDGPDDTSRWPLVVDPILTSVYDTKLVASDGAADDVFCAYATSAGDINGDGHQDLAVGASGDDDAGSGSGAAYLYYGSEAGIDVASELMIVASDAIATMPSASWRRPVMSMPTATVTSSLVPWWRIDPPRTGGPPTCSTGAPPASTWGANK